MSERSELMATADLAEAGLREDDDDVEAVEDATDDDSHRDERDDRDARLEPLLEAGEGGDLQRRWHTLQAAFVDDPQRTVEQADELVAEVMQRLAQMFAHERQALEGQWSSGNDVSTEDLRVALQRYRSFFERLLAA
jgi:hypothetical protein